MAKSKAKKPRKTKAQSRAEFEQRKAKALKEQTEHAASTLAPYMYLRHIKVIAALKLLSKAGLDSVIKDLQDSTPFEGFTERGEYVGDDPELIKAYAILTALDELYVTYAVSGAPETVVIAQEEDA